MENYTYDDYITPAGLVMDEIHQAEKAIGLIASFAIIHAAFKTWGFTTRNANNILNARTAFWFIIYCIQTIGNYILLLSSITCLYIFVIYKGQTVQYVSLPDEHNETVIKFFIIIAFGAKVVEMILIMHHHRSVNIFFIDWEQPQKMLNHDVTCESPHRPLEKSYVQKCNSHINCNLSRMSCGRIQNRGNSGIASKSFCNNGIVCRHSNDSECLSTGREIFSTCLDIKNIDCEYDFTSNWSSVSTWRTCFIANQWLKIKTKRKTSVIFQMIVTLFILEIIGLKFWSLAEPKWSLTCKSSCRIQENFTFSCAIATGTFIIVYSLQWLTCTLYRIYVKNFLQEFVDLCSVANISIFILSHNYLGYYIHGRSVHGFADKDLASLMNDLECEEANQCAHRGLVPGTSEQMFIVAVSNTFRSCYDAILLNENKPGCDKFSQPYMSDNRFSNEQWTTRCKVHDFFCNHLDHCLDHADYTIQEKCFVEKLCNIELANKSEKSIFYIDKNYSFNETIFHGKESALATFELITFLLILALGGNWIACALGTILVSELIAFIAQVDQKKLLATKTLIDKRFLI